MSSFSKECLNLIISMRTTEGEKKYRELVNHMFKALEFVEKADAKKSKWKDNEKNQNEMYLDKISSTIQKIVNSINKETS